MFLRRLPRNFRVPGTLPGIWRLLLEGENRSSKMSPERLLGKSFWNSCDPHHSLKWRPNLWPMKNRPYKRPQKETKQPYSNHRFSGCQLVSFGEGIAFCSWDTAASDTVRYLEKSKSTPARWHIGKSTGWINEDTVNRVESMYQKRILNQSIHDSLQLNIEPCSEAQKNRKSIFKLGFWGAKQFVSER